MAKTFRKSMYWRPWSFVVILLTIFLPYNIAISSIQPQYIIKAEKNKAFDKSFLIETFNKTSAANIAACLGHCLNNCRCQSFQICNDTECQLCSSHREENSSLLHDQDGCIYAVYETRHSVGDSQAQNVEDQCLGMPCLNAHCCQRPGLCSGKKICKQHNSKKQPWKRFTCECKEGYNGANCDQPIRSCVGYLDRHRQSGLYKVIASDHSLSEVYCHFDSDGHAWTLVQSFSFARRALPNSDFKHRLTTDHPISENELQWSGYRLNKPRMRSINLNSSYIAFTCDYEKEEEFENSDYLQISLDELGNNKDITRNNPNQNMNTFEGRINEKSLTGCKIKLHQDQKGLHVHITKTDYAAFVPTTPNGCTSFHYFSYFTESNCLMPTHRCTKNVNSTTQLWFGYKNFN